MQIRLQGEQAEARAFLDALAAGGAEVAVGTTKDRGEYAHLYATAVRGLRRCQLEPDGRRSSVPTYLASSEGRLRTNFSKAVGRTKVGKPPERSVVGCTSIPA